jgi:periplasmic protein TonB
MEHDSTDTTDEPNRLARRITFSGCIAPSSGGARPVRLVATSNATASQRRRRASYRPPAGIPLRRTERWGVPLSVIAHVLLVTLLVSPVFGPSDPLSQLGAGGAGPSGGGGGGLAGPRPSSASGALPAGERLHYVGVAADAAPIPPQSEPATPTVEPPLDRTPAKSELEPRRPEVEPVSPMASAAPAVGIASPIASIGGGIGGGRGGAGGTGPGSGGGVGTGIGPGRGSSTGMGTGGGEGTVYPATPDFLVMPALPVPVKVRGKTIELRFTLDERGKILKVEFEPTGDGSYDRQLRTRLAEFRFRPAHKMDGTPVPSVYVTRLTL